MAKLTEVCANIKNYFLNGSESRVCGTFTIESGTVPLSTLLENQYFRIIGSILNDGVYKNTPEDLSELTPETFTGEIWSMSVPRDFEQLCEDISEWRKKNESLDSVNMSPYASEGFGGYSYSKSNAGNSITWQQQFKSRLNVYRRIKV